VTSRHGSFRRPVFCFSPTLSSSSLFLPSPASSASPILPACCSKVRLGLDNGKSSISHATKVQYGTAPVAEPSSLLATISDAAAISLPSVENFCLDLLRHSASIQLPWSRRQSQQGSLDVAATSAATRYLSLPHSGARGKNKTIEKSSRACIDGLHPPQQGRTAHTNHSRTIFSPHVDVVTIVTTPTTTCTRPPRCLSPSVIRGLQFSLPWLRHYYVRRHNRL
jgi:hypothetical protein